jgi:hypothetical protein
MNQHFAVKGVERTHPEIAAGQQMLDSAVSVVDSVEKRAHESGLKDLVPRKGAVSRVMRNRRIAGHVATD